jgi:hypothetical protein
VGVRSLAAQGASMLCCLGLHTAQQQP